MKSIINCPNQVFPTLYMKIAIMYACISNNRLKRNPERLKISSVGLNIRFTHDCSYTPLTLKHLFNPG